MQFDFQLAPGASQTIDVKGRFFKYKSGTGLIRVRTSMGGFVDVLPGQGIENVNFTSLTIADKSNAGNSGSILAGDFDFRDDRITGTVDVVDGGKARSNTGAACIAYVNMSAVATKYPHVQLLNPTGSSKTIYVEQISIYCAETMNGGAGLLRCDAALPDLAGFGSRKRVGMTGTSLAQLRRESAATQQGQGIAPYVGAIDKTLRLFKFSEPMQLDAGVGLSVAGGTAGEGIGVTFEYFEESV